MKRSREQNELYLTANLLRLKVYELSRVAVSVYEKKRIRMSLLMFDYLRRPEHMFAFPVRVEPSFKDAYVEIQLIGRDGGRSKFFIDPKGVRHERYDKAV